MFYYKFFIILFLFLSLSFADAGPSLPTPEVEVKFMKNGQDYTGGIELVYHCTTELKEGNRAMDLRDANMSCSAGVCKNDDWFYKFNPCYSGESGYFLYKTDNSNFKRAAGDFVFEEGRIYKMSIDIDSNKAEVVSSAFCCFPIFLFLSVGVLIFNTRGREWR